MNISKLFKIVFLTFIFLLPFQTVYLLRESFINGEKWQYGTIGIYFSDLLLISVLAFFFVRKFVSKKNISSIIRPLSHINYQSALVLFLIWAGLSILWAGDQMLAWSFFMKLLLAVGLFWLVQSWEAIDVKKLILVLLCAGMIQSGIGIWQFLSQQSINSSILGMSAYQASEAGSSVLKIDSGRFLRAYGTFSHPNILGGFLGVILIIGIAYIVFCIPYKKQENKGISSHFFLSFITYSVSLIVIFLGLVLTFSRSAWLGVVVGILALGVVVFFQKEWEVRIRFLKILFMLGLASIVFGSLFREQIFPRFDTVTIEREGSITDRIQSLRDARTLIGEGNILLGTGIGNFTGEIMRLQPGRPVWNIQPAHNVFILIFAELGIVGFILFVVFFGSIIFQIKNIFQKKERVIFGIALLVLIPSLFLDHFLWSSHFGLFFFFLLLGLASRKL